MGMAATRGPPRKTSALAIFDGGGGESRQGGRGAGGSTTNGKRSVAATGVVGSRGEEEWAGKKDQDGDDHGCCTLATRCDLRHLRRGVWIGARRRDVYQHGL